jgi:hypothetical protein
MSGSTLQPAAHWANHAGPGLKPEACRHKQSAMSSRNLLAVRSYWRQLYARNQLNVQRLSILYTHLQRQIHVIGAHSGEEGRAALH